MSDLKTIDLLNKGCEIKVNGQTFYCYNVTSLMHFVKIIGNFRSMKPSNFYNISKDQLLSYIERDMIQLSVGSIE